MSPPPFATVLVPTHDHTALIPYALRSIQAQTMPDFELFVVGDGAPPATRAAVLALASGDPRIRYFDFPKGERHGELNRHFALRQARGTIVAYCGDDDLWLPDHLASMKRLLRHADFGNSVQVEIYLDDQLNIRLGSLADGSVRRQMLEQGFGFFGLSEWAHTSAAYRSLAEGWSPAPPGVPSDQFMIRKFVASPQLAGASGSRATALHFPSPLRREWPMMERIAELQRYTGLLTSSRMRSFLRSAINARRKAEMPAASRLPAMFNAFWLDTMLQASSWRRRVSH